jgi:hypothetical protein
MDEASAVLKAAGKKGGNFCLPLVLKNCKYSFDKNRAVWLKMAGNIVGTASLGVKQAKKYL